MPCGGNSSPAAVIIESMTEKPVYAIDVAAVTEYLAEQSGEAAARYVFAYPIPLRNVGSVAAQLISRHWIITDAQRPGAGGARRRRGGRAAAARAGPDI